ncbi:hypothetical protein RUND412_009314 [Rhizina undulata]
MPMSSTYVTMLRSRSREGKEDIHTRVESPPELALLLLLEEPVVEPFQFLILRPEFPGGLQLDTVETSAPSSVSPACTPWKPLVTSPRAPPDVNVAPP